MSELGHEGQPKRLAPVGRGTVGDAIGHHKDRGHVDGPAGLPPHELRHTAASLAIAEGPT